MERRGIVGEYVMQLWVLLKKNWWLSVRFPPHCRFPDTYQIAHIRPTLVQLASPFLFMILLFVLQQLYNHDQREKCMRHHHHSLISAALLPQPLVVGNISHCQVFMCVRYLLTF